MEVSGESSEKLNTVYTYKDWKSHSTWFLGWSWELAVLMDAFQQVFTECLTLGVEDKNGYHAGKLMKIVLQSQDYTCLRSAKERTVNSRGTVIILTAGNGVYMLMPWAMKLSQEKPSCYRAG